MPEDGSRLCNVAALAEVGRQFELAVPLARLERIAPLLLSTEGMVQGAVMLGHEQGRIIADVTAQATVSLQCQRCLQPMSLPLAGSSRVALVESEALVADVPPEFETALAPDGRLRLADLLEEELLLALPPAPRHPEGHCPGDAAVQKTVESVEPTQRPFASLGDLLKSQRPKS